ncbi:MAG: hypothetical protein ACQETH_14495 [Candidatus Rifleibacteriota bacterium]
MFIQSPGATTFLATVTARIIGAEKLFNEKHKGFDDEFEEQIFTFPVTRADLWAVKMGEITNIEKHFPEKSIARAYMGILKNPAVHSDLIKIIFLFPVV